MQNNPQDDKDWPELPLPEDFPDGSDDNGDEVPDPSPQAEWDEEVEPQEPDQATPTPPPPEGETELPPLDAKRRMVEANPDVADRVRIYCFLRRMSVKTFVTQTLSEALKPYEAWVESFRRLRGRRP